MAVHHRPWPQRSGGRETLESSLLCKEPIQCLPPLQTYRVYWFDSMRHSVTSDWIKAASDEDAMAQAVAAGFGSRCEIWDGKRLVAQLEEERRTG